MGFFIVILFAAGIVFWLIKQRADRLRQEWTFAANRLHLNYSPGGVANPHWIYGKKAGMRFDIKTFSRRADDGTNGKWTGYRVQFASELPETRFSEVLRKRLTQRFQECEIDTDQIFCAKPYIETDASVIVDNVNRILAVVKRIIADSEADEDRPVPPPPAAKESGPEPDRQPDFKFETKEADLSEGREAISIEVSPEAAIAKADSPAPPPESLSATESNTDDPAPEPEPVPLSTQEPAREKTLADVSRDLFDHGRNRYQISRQFEDHYAGLTLLGEGKMLRVDNFSNDRVFGRGPGTLAEVEVYEPEESPAGHRSVRAVVQLPEVESIRDLRESVGDSVTVSGKLVRCDAFDGKLFLGDGELA